MNQMTIVQTDQLDVMMEELKRLHRHLDAVEMTPKPEWLIVIEYAKLIGKGERTVVRMIQSGKLEIKHTGGIRLIHVNLAA